MRHTGRREITTESLTAYLEGEVTPSRSRQDRSRDPRVPPRRNAGWSVCDAFEMRCANQCLSIATWISCPPCAMRLVSPLATSKRQRDPRYGTYHGVGPLLPLVVSW
jgi:hypothetical protein